MLREIVIASAIVLSVAAPATAGQWEKSFPLTGHPTFVLRTRDADVHVLSAAGNTARMRVTTTGLTIGPKGVRVEASQNGDRIECDVLEPHVWFRLAVNRRVRVDVTLPPEADVDITTGDGAVTLAPLGGTERVHTGDGEIQAEGLKGEVHLTTGDGAIHARGLDGALEAHSSDGALEIEGRFDRLDLSTSDGRIEASALAGSRVTSGWTLHSGDGSLTLRVPRDLKADFDLHTGDGALHLDLPLEVAGKVERHALRGRLNGGGPLVEVHTGDGSIRVQPL